MTQEESDRRAAFLIGERVYLRPMEPEDLPLIRKWVNDPEIRGLIGEALPSSRASVEEHLEAIRKDRDRVWFSIVLKEDGRVVGFNQKALRFYEKVGFKREGVWRESYYYNHTFHDFVMMSILEDEFRALHKVAGRI
ncbi:MAG: GNAT family N-acetyltransferase [Firmicutes bacterium]|nr:GNAT family N-acetyltransferase [Bacillota bacterium]